MSNRFRMQECRRHNIHKRHGACRAYWARPTTVFYDVSISRSASMFIDAEGLEDEVDEYSNNAQPENKSDINTDGARSSLFLML